jgi:tRNA-splicing ligase RtcB
MSTRLSDRGCSYKPSMLAQASARDLISDTPFRWTLPRQRAMRVPGVIFASEALLPSALGDRSLDQVMNVATLPGIVKASFAMSDIHWGYGFPIGGVAATDIAGGDRPRFRSHVAGGESESRRLGADYIDSRLRMVLHRRSAR